MIDNIIEKSKNEPKISFLEMTFTEDYEEKNNVKYIVKQNL
jgi:hypothetical protein